MDELLDRLAHLEESVFLLLGAGLIAFIVVTWSTPRAGLAFAGTVIEVFAVPIVLPYFVEADRFMTSAAIGAGAGAVIGTALGNVLVEWRRLKSPRRRPHQAALVVSRATLGGFVGFALGLSRQRVDQLGREGSSLSRHTLNAYG